MTNYKKWFTSLVAGLALLIAGCVTPPTTMPSTGDIPPLISQWAEKHVWKIKGEDGGHGSGFWINTREMVTACHVVNKLRNNKGVAIPNDKSIVVTFKVTSCNKDTDVAILERTSLDDSIWFDPTPISYVLPSKNSRVYGAGYPLWFPLTINDGWFGEEIIFPTGEIRYTNSVPTIMGDSGSPLLSIRSGKVFVEGVRVSLATVPDRFSRDYITHMAMATSGRQILTELISNNARKQGKK